MTQEEANRYWAGRDWKKYVVTLQRGRTAKPEEEVKYVTARTASIAVAVAKRHAMCVNKPTRVQCRLATAYDLGCVSTAAAEVPA